MNKKKIFYLEYSIIFVFLSFLIVTFYVLKGNSLINFGGDGYRQYYKALIYISRHLKEIVTNIFSGNFVIPQWGFSIGEGSDIIKTFCYYGFGDPINLFSIFINENYLYIFYDVSIFIRLYVAGTAFSKYCFYLKDRNNASLLIGTLLYAFCGFSISSLYGHIYFLNALVYLPLVIYGTEKLIRERKGILLTVSVLLSTIANFYFFYMIVLTTVIYVIVRIISIDQPIKERINIVIQITLYSFLGVLLSSIISLPIMHSMLDNTRLSSSISNDALYSKEYYKSLLTQFVFNSGYYGGYSIFGLFGLVTLFSTKGRKQEKIFIIISFLFLLFPFFGKLYNAMTYVTDRWLFIVDFLMSFVIVDTFDEFIKSSNKIKYYTFTAIYFLLSIFINKDIWQIYLLLFVMAIAIIAILQIVKKEKLKSIVCLLSTFGSLMLVIVYVFSPYYWDYAKNGTNVNVAKNVFNSEFVVLEDIDDRSFYRYSGDSLTTNASILGDISSTGYYWSLANNNVIEYRTCMGLSDRNNHHYDSYNDSFVLNSLSSVKYYIYTSKEDKYPHGYSYLTTNNGFDVYKSEYALPLVYGYEKAIDYDTWNNQDLLLKQELLTEYAILDDIDSKPLDYQSENNKIDFEIVNKLGLEIDKKRIDVLDFNNKLTISSSSDKEGEYYLVINDYYSDTNVEVTILSDDINESLIYKCESNPGYQDRHNYAINLGYFEEFNENIDLIFSEVSSIGYSSIEIVCMPLTNSIENVNKLYRSNNVEIQTNRVSIDVDLDTKKHLCFSIPYEKGWKAYVDGEQKDLVRTNVQYMGLQLDKGNHNIELVYSTPLLKEGAIVTVVGVVAFVYLIIRDKKTKSIK